MSFKIKGADNRTIAIEDGEYYFNTKARARRMMLNSLSSDARRVYACLELATMGFQQELAVVMEKNRKQRPLSPADISRQTGLPKQEVRRGLAELEAEGLAERRAADGGALRNGQVLIYSWAEPREATSKKGRHARLPFPDWFPQSWEPLKPFITRHRLCLAIDEVGARAYLSEGEEAARAYQEAEKVVARFLKGVCAQPRPNKVERTERTRGERTEAAPPVSPSPGSGFIQQNPPSSSSAFSSPRKAKAEEEESDLFHIFKTEYPAGHFDGPKAKPSFDGKTKAEQLHAIERLRVYKKSERWKDDDGSWIPFASKWLASAYSEEPPPVVKKKSRTASAGNGSGEESYFERRVREEREGSNG